MDNAAFIANASGQLRWAGHEVRCALGRSGVTPAESKREGDGASPIGVWRMRQVLWRSDRIAAPATRLPAVELIPEAGWCDAPGDPFYNRPVLLPYAASHERLWREDHIYDLIVELGYNDAPVIAGKGSAIFLHVAREDYSPTEGCVACALPDLLALLADAKPGDAIEIRV
ncbi:MAG: L,D-transpeptidase family protein [Hyphomonadaceae bacterium]|nr:L,D-transpeptidase family protein [Hyphomonadaceae bacterium]